MLLLSEMKEIHSRKSFQVFVISVPPNELLYLKSGAVCATL